MKRIVIIGATSGIGKEVAKLYIQKGYRVGIAGRRLPLLEDLQSLNPANIVIEAMDITLNDATNKLTALIDKLGGMDLFVLSSGIGFQNYDLHLEIELNTACTNVDGFMRMVISAYHYFCKQGYGHLAVISSIAGTKGLGIVPAYSATKRFQNIYLQALSQLAHMQHKNVYFTDIRPGFVSTDLLKDGNYPFLMSPSKVARQIEKAIKQKKRVVVIDWRYKILVFFWRLIPSCLWRILPIKTK